MLPEDGVLLTYILKRNQEDSEIKLVDSSTKPETKVAKEDVDYTSGKFQVHYEYSIDILISSDEIGENSRKSCRKKEIVEDTTVILSTSSLVVEDEEAIEEAMRNQLVISLTMVDKLAKMVNNLGSEIRKEKNLKLLAIDLMLRMQVVLDEFGVFLENNSINILDIINMIPDKSVVAWKEKLDGRTEIDSGENQNPGTVDNKRKPYKRSEKETRSKGYLDNAEVH